MWESLRSIGTAIMKKLVFLLLTLALCGCTKKQTLHVSVEDCQKSGTGYSIRMFVGPEVVWAGNDVILRC